jgi:hypothetical protein
MPEKMRTENPGQKLQIRPENLSLLVPGGRFLHSFIPEKLRLKNPSKNYTYYRKIPRPVTAEMAGKSDGNRLRSGFEKEVQRGFKDTEQKPFDLLYLQVLPIPH